jgi:tetratricopeptide (TPR) repeat protein
MAANVQNILGLYSEKFDFFDCPRCGAKASISPSLVGLFVVEDKLLLLDRGMDPEPVARKALAPLATTLGANVAPIRVADLSEFKATFAAQTKATAKAYPYPHLNPASTKENILHWRHLQGELLSVMLAGALGAVPKFGLHTAQPDGDTEDQSITLNLIFDLIVDLFSDWTISLPSITSEASLEEALLRLIDSCGAAAFIADRLVEMLERNRKLIEENGGDNITLFYFKAAEASIFAMLKRDNPHASEWAYTYLMARLAVRGADPAESGHRFQMSRERALATISYKDAWNAAARAFGSLFTIEDAAKREKLIEALALAVDDLARDGLFAAIVEGGVRVGPRSQSPDTGHSDAANQHTPETFANMLLRMRTDHAGLLMSNMLKLWQLSWFSDSDAVAELFDRLEPGTIDNPEERADLLTWFGERMKLLGASGPALQRIGREPAPWEQLLSKYARRRLWTERSNALRLAGERAAALEVALSTLELTRSDPEASDSHKAVASLNCGILLRENGRFEEAEVFLLEAIHLAPFSQRWLPWQSLAATYIQMGRLAAAADALVQARETAAGADNRDTQVSLLVSEIAVRMQLGQYERADALLRECPAPESLPSAGLIGYGTILRSLALRGPSLDTHRATAEMIVTRLSEMVDQFERRGNELNAQLACFSAAILAEAFDLDDAGELWTRDAEISIKSGRLPHTVTTIELAIRGIREDPTRFAECVSVIPAAIAQQAGGIELNALNMGALAPLDGPFERLTMLTYQLGLGPQAVQILAELRRNAHFKARESSDGEMPQIGSAPSTAEAMQPDDADFIVIEFSDVGDGASLGLITRIAPGDAKIDFLGPSPDVDLPGAAQQVGARLANWRRTRAGEPHAVPQWEEISARLKASCSELLPNGGHVVVIDHPLFSGLPFHIALVPEWTVSYAADWLAVEAAVRANGAAVAPSRIGVLHAPRSNETVAVRRALETSMERARVLADDNGLACDIAGPGSADAHALRQLLATTDILKILCHGQVSKDNHEVALIIDHEGESAPGYSFGVVLQASRGHRFGREQLQGLSKASSTVFLGACSSGVVSVAGLDERTSFALLLGEAGTKAVVAPRWKIDAELALPVLDDAMDRFIGGVHLVDAVAQAAAAAVARGVPSWQANAFVVEGAWL